MALQWGAPFIITVVITSSLSSVSDMLAQIIDEKKPSFFTASVGEYVVMDCDLDYPQGNPIPYSVRWMKEGQEILSFENGNFESLPEYEDRVSLVPKESHYGEGSINLTSIRESDNGWYECIVVFPNRSPSTRPNGTWFHLKVTGGTLLKIPPTNQTKLEGESAHFVCETTDADDVSWLKDGVPLDELPDLLERTYQSEIGSLTINTTAIDDLGEYTCVVNNTAGDVQTARAFLNVEYKAKVVYSPDEVYLQFGHPGVLDCHFRANPPLTNLRWEKDGFLYDPYNVQGVYHSRNASLFFEKVDDTHAGVYRCKPFNKLGSEGLSGPMRVTVQRAPVFTIVPHNLYLKKLGETLVMPCDAVDGAGSHRPQFIWRRKDGIPLPKDRITLTNGNLTIENIQKIDNGVYQCVAYNQAATVSFDTDVIVENRTVWAPYNLSATSTHTTVTIKWAPGYGHDGGDYSIWYRPTDTSEWRTMRIWSQSTTEAIVKNLEPGRMYEFMVLSQDKHGDGMFSKAIKVKTLDSGANHTSAERIYIESFQQIGPPINVSVAHSDDGYLVTWEPPHFGHDLLKSYTVRWNLIGEDKMHSSIEITDTKYLVKTLEEDATYQFQVVAMSVNGYVEASKKFEIYVPGHRSIRAISLGIIVGLAFLLIVAASSWYFRRMYIKRIAQQEKEIS